MTKRQLIGILVLVFVSTGICIYATDSWIAARQRAKAEAVANAAERIAAQLENAQPCDRVVTTSTKFKNPTLADWVVLRVSREYHDQVGDTILYYEEAGGARAGQIVVRPKALELARQGAEAAIITHVPGCKLHWEYRSE